MSSSSETTVVVLLSTYNGGKHLDGQLASIFGQTTPVELVVRDDGSEDGTIEVLESWRGRFPIEFSLGRNLGPARSYLDLLVSAPDASYYAFADQDDVWDSDKLETGLGLLSQVPADRPALYFSATRVVDEKLRFLEDSRLSGTPTFEQALVRNFASGCTMLFNRRLLELVRDAPYVELGMHDSWLLKVCLAVGGSVYYDPKPHISYRQHSANVVGSEPSGIRRLLRWWRSPAKTRSREAFELLARYRDSMSETRIHAAELLSTYDQQVSGRLRVLADPRFRSGDLGSRISMVLSIVFGRL